MIFESQIEANDLKDVSLRSLAHLGDAVFELYEREKEFLPGLTTKKIHESVVSRVNATSQAKLLEKLQTMLTDSEKDLVRRARNMKVTKYKKVEQSIYRQATAFEVLVGFLYLTDLERLKELLKATSEIDLSS